MIQIRPSDSRGRTSLDWLDSRHTFSFGQYHDPHHMGLRALRVINDDRVVPGAGFGMHGHRDKEIVTYVLDGQLEHRDSLGNGSILQAGQVQRMSAGTGIRHSEFNPSKSQPVRFLQIWIEPSKTDLPPSYEEIHLPAQDGQGRMTLMASPDGRDISATIHQNAAIWIGRPTPQSPLQHALAQGRAAYVQVTAGRITLNGQSLSDGDGAAIESEPNLTLAGQGEFLLFDLA